MKILYSSLLLLIYSITAVAQRDPCVPQCNIYFNDISRMRCPDEETVAKLNNLTVSEYGYNPDFVKLGGPHCGDKAAALLKRYRDEDQKKENELRGKYCYAQLGWRNVKDCEHGGPPPNCCPHPLSDGIWEKVSPSLAMKSFKDEQEKVYQKRLREIADVVKPCKIQSVNDNKFDVDNSYNISIDLINKFRDDPSQYSNVQNSHGAKISQLKQQYDAEASKKEKADIKKLNQLAQSIKQEEEALSKLSENAAKEKQDKVDKEKIAKEKAAKEKKASQDSKSRSDTTKGKSSKSYTPVESDYAREMRLRREAQQANDKIENEIMGTAAAVTAGAMAYAISKNEDNKDEDEELSFYLKGTIGLGIQYIPITRNMTFGFNNYSTGATTYVNKSEKGSTNHYSVNAGLLLAIFNDQFVSFRLSPVFTWGMNALQDGTSGNHMSYGSGATLGIGRQFKVLLKGDFIKRSGNLTEDNAVIGIDSKGYSYYKYSTLKYGVGIYLGFGGHDSFAELSGYRENISFLKPIKAEVYSYEAKISFEFLALAVQYAHNYPIAGELKYPTAYTKEKADLFTMTLYVPFKIFSSY